MKIKVTKNQTIYDIAKQYYGNVEAVAEVFEMNPNICNTQHVEYQIDKPILVGSWIEINDRSYLKENNVIRNINKEITLYENI